MAPVKVCTAQHTTAFGSYCSHNPLPLAPCAPTDFCAGWLCACLPAPTGILGDFQAQWAASGGAPLQLLTKYVPNIFNARPTPSSVEAAVKQSLSNLKVMCPTAARDSAAVARFLRCGTADVHD